MMLNVARVTAANGEATESDEDKSKAPGAVIVASEKIIPSHLFSFQ